MANQNQSQPRDSAFSLTKEAKQRLEQMKKDVAESEQRLQDLEDLGLDTSRLREQIEWSKKAIDKLTKRL